MSDAMPPPPPGSEPFEPPPPQRRGKAPVVIAAGLVAVLVIAVIVVATRPKSGTSDGAQTYAANGVRLSYPSGWIHGASILANETKSSLWSETFAPTAGTPDGVLVTQYQLNQDVSSVPASALESELKSVATGLAQGSGGDLTSDLTPTTVGTLPAYQVSFTAVLAGTQYSVELTTVFDGTDQYNINCQYSEAQAQQIKAGCQQVRDTFQVTGSTASP